MSECVVCKAEIADGRRLCGNPKCKSEHSRNTIKASFARHGGEITKFRKTNGMDDPEVRARVSKTLRLIRHRPPVQGGNGRGPTKWELLLSEALGWPTNVIVSTNGGRMFGYPTHYKLDIGNDNLKIAVEVDGASHGSISRQNQDSKKDAWLRARGWKVIRFTNRQVDRDTSGCLSKIKELAAQ